MLTIITLTTDFGSSGSYVGQMKGSILRRSRNVHIVDLSHDVGPQQVLEGARLLAEAAFEFPPGTIHIAVVDPGVGTTRKMIYAELGEQRFLAPNNGLLTFAARRAVPRMIIALEDQRFWNHPVSATFHGRDLLAPVAAHLTLGISPRELGPQLTNLVELESPQPLEQGASLVGCIVAVDHFGNAVTNITRDVLQRWSADAPVRVMALGQSIPLYRTYGDATPGELIALFGSRDELELAVVNGNAANKHGLAAGTSVAIRRDEATSSP